MPANLTQPCAPLQSVDGVKTMANLLEWAVETTNQYGECARKHNSLVGALK